MGMTPSVTDLAEAALGQLHERLLDGDPVAPAELAERLLPLLRSRLAGWATTVDDPHMVPSAIGLVIARYLTDPARFDPAVFCTRTADVKAMLALLKQRRIAAQDLTAYKGRTTRAVKVGTYHRAKGLEFKEVYLPHVSTGLVPPPAGTPTRRRPRSWPAASSSSA